MIENKILIASAIMAVIMLSGVASQCTIPAPDGRNLASGEQAHHLSNCSLFYKCHVTTILTLSCDGFNPYFDPCNLECQSNDDYCLRTSCGVETPSTESSSPSTESSSSATDSSSLATDSSSLATESTVPPASTPENPTAPTIIPTPPTNQPTNPPAGTCTDPKDITCCCNSFVAGADCPNTNPADAECCCDITDPTCVDSCL